MNVNLEIYNREFRQRYAWQPERPPNSRNNTTTTQDFPTVRTPSPSVSGPSPRSSVMPYDFTHVRTFRVFEAVKLDNYISTYDNY